MGSLLLEEELRIFESQGNGSGLQGPGGAKYTPKTIKTCKLLFFNTGNSTKPVEDSFCSTERFLSANRGATDPSYTRLQYCFMAANANLPNNYLERCAYELDQGNNA